MEDGMFNMSKLLILPGYPMDTSLQFRVKRQSGHSTQIRLIGLLGLHRQKYSP